MRCYCGTSEVSLIESFDQCMWALPPTGYFPNLIVTTNTLQITIATLRIVVTVPFAVDQTHLGCT